MTDSKVNNNKWQNLNWEKKVQICQQGIANQDSLLHTYVVIFIALQAMLFVAVFSEGWGQWWSIPIAVMAIGLAILFARLFELRGNAVDRWGEILYALWDEAGESELAAYHKGSVEKRERRREKFGRFLIFKGWGLFGRFNSARWMLITLMPSVLVVVWILMMVMSFIN